MIKTLTLSILSSTLCGLSSLFLTTGAMAQTAPAWSGARAVGHGYYLSATVDAAGNSFEAGSFEGSVVVGGATLTSQGGSDGYLAKYSPSGTLAWVRQLGSTGYDIVTDIALDADGNAYITGDFTGSITLGNQLTLDGGTNTLAKVLVVRYSPQGTPEWAQQSSATAIDSPIGSGGSSIGLDAVGSVHVVGFSHGGVTFGSTTVKAPEDQSGTFLVRLSAVAGEIQSLVQSFNYLTPSGAATYTYPQLAVASTGETYILSTFNQKPVFGAITLTSRGSTDVLVAKYNKQGTFEWVQQFGGAADDRVAEGVVDASGNLYVTTYFKGPSTFGNVTLPGAGNYDGGLVKYSPQGVMQWVRSSGGSGMDLWSGISLDAAGNPYVVGNFSDVAQFGSIQLTSAGDRDIAIAAYTTEGEFRWVQQAGGPGHDAGIFIGQDSRNNIYVLGEFSNTCAFGPHSLSTNAGPENFIARLGSTVLATLPNRLSLALSMYPNPATDAVQLSSVPAGSRVHLFDALGREVRTTLLASNATISVRGLKPGLYILRATATDDRQYTGRLLVE